MSRLVSAVVPFVSLFVLGCQSDPVPKPVGPESLRNRIDLAAKWLAAHQDEDGKWDADQFMKHDREGVPSDGPGNGVHDVGATGLATLALLATGSTLRGGPHQESLQRAAKWLQRQQQDSGLIGAAAAHDFIYDHAIASFALCEAYGLSQSQPLKSAAQKALNYLESHRNPYAVWRYQPRDNDNDTSVTTWATLALCSGKYFGLETNPAAFSVIGAWYDQVTDPTGHAGYTKAGEPSSRKAGDHAQHFPPEKGEAMTAAALYGRYVLGQTPKEKPVMDAAAKILAKNPPRWIPDRIDPYYWYFGTFAAFQAGGETWNAWRTGLDAIAGAQRSDGNFAGSWDPLGVWDEDGGRVYSTALYTLCLTAAERHTRIVK